MARNTDTHVWKNWQWKSDFWQDTALAVAQRIAKNKSRYSAVQRVSGLKWQLVGIIHSLEASGDFGSWLANGDSLRAPTVQVPAGLGRGYSFPISWEDAAEISLAHDNVPKDLDTIAQVASYLESFNGFGYRNMGLPSPYLYSGCTEYVKGKYVSDGKYDSEAVSQQIGAMCILRALQELDLLNVSNNGTINWKESAMQKVTWYQIQRGDNGMVILTGYDGPQFIEQITTNQSSEIATFLNKYGSHSVLVAPADKPVASSPKPTASLGNKKLLDFYSSKANYDKVHADVMEWFGTTSNACAAFLSTALRMVGVPVPHALDDKGYDVSLVAQSLADWLERQGWKRVKDVRAGDVIVSEDDPDYPGFAAHIHMISSGVDARGYAESIDNQQFKYSRNITVQGNKTPMAYALRAP